ncbi:M20 aminoacylase family protein [Thalassovita sp.]|uniref:M20 aminoacylase family protein n=1 Tax=Thalassovita sp. TaxID=1979401 RepID=UPI0029DE739C|nr:M20 aminoacylase family protein [Thalassovita sp.]
MNLPLPNSIASSLSEFVAVRRDLHQHPELVFDLPRTAGIVAQTLKSFGFDDVVEGIARTGVVGILHGKSGPAANTDQRVLLRADMDALPIAEATRADHASTIEGAMHACGHDGHTAMLLGAAKHLAETRDFHGTLVFCFQPAEELAGGAKVMIDEGLLDRFPVKAAYAIHNWPEMPVGHFGVIHGGAMASADGVMITVKGSGGHAAQPEKARDPVVCAAAIVTAAQTIVSRTVSPFDQAVVSITSIHGGDAWNVIPDQVQMRCNFRCFSEEVSARLESELRRLCASTAEAHGCTASVDRPPLTPYPPTINHPAETAIAVQAMTAVVGAENVHQNLRPVMGSEDFAFFLREVPGAYVFIGNGDSAPLHNPGYDFNDDALGYGIAYWAELARRVLPAAV